MLYALKRILLLVPVMFIVVSLTFVLMRLAGDPVDFILGDNPLPEVRETFIKQYHLDESIQSQYFRYLKNLTKGSLGQSFFSTRSINTLLIERYQATLQLAITSILLAILISFPLGILSGVRSGTTIDKGTLLFSLLGISMPSFYLGPLLALFFSIKLDWFPVSGRELTGSIWLPAITLGLGMSALLTRFTRSSLIEALRFDYIRTARAKGLNEFTVILKHATRTALIPIIAILGLQFGTLLAGAVITEKIFSWPGVGSLMLEAISRRDYALVQACILVISTTYVIVNLLTDLTYQFVDPRLRLSEQKL